MKGAISAGEAILRAARLSGVDCVFGNPGTEFAALIDALARDHGRGRLPRPVTVPHEFLGAAMAHGHYLASGRPQMSAAHATVGAANALTALIGAARMNIPLLYFAGRTPVRETSAGGGRDKFIQWPQETFDTGGFAREWLKWDYELRAPEMAAAAVRRGLSLAMISPRGPVGLWAPREVLLSRVPVVDEEALNPAREPEAAAGDLDRAAQWLRASRRGLIIANRTGVDRATVALLGELARKAGLAVAAPNAHYMSLPADHPCLIGPDAESALAEADFVLVLDVDVPWCPLEKGPGRGAKVVSAGPDPLFGRIPMRSHRSDLALTASPRSVLEGLLARLSGKAPRARATWVAARRAAFERGLAARRKTALASRVLTEDFVAVRLSERLNNAVIFNELSLNGELLRPSEPGSYFRSGSASGLGWGFGAALGHALAEPRKTTIAVLGDGAYYLSNPAAAHWAARAHGLPVVVVVLNNGGMPSLRAPVDRFYPGGAAAKSGRYAFTDLRPAGDFAALAEAFGGKGLTVRRPAELGPALDSALKASRQGRHALVDVRLG